MLTGWSSSVGHGVGWGVSYSETPNERLGGGGGGYSETPDERLGVGRGQLQWNPWWKTGGGGWGRLQWNPWWKIGSGERSVTVEPLMKDWGGAEGGGVTVEPLMKDWEWGEVSYSGKTGGGGGGVYSGTPDEGGYIGTPDERLGVGEVSYSGTPNERLGVGRGQLQWNLQRKTLGGGGGVTVEPLMKDWEGVGGLQWNPWWKMGWGEVSYSGTPTTPKKDLGGGGGVSYRGTPDERWRGGEEGGTVEPQMKDWDWGGRGLLHWYS